MAGETISRRLEPPTYEAFYQLAHSYSEHLLIKAAGIKMLCDMVARLENALPDNVNSLARFRADMQLLRTEGKALQEATRACFWPHVAAAVPFEAAREMDEAFNRERWQPYTGEAWDKFFTGVVEQLKPRITAFNQLVEIINIPDNFVTDDPTLNNQVAFIRDFKKNLYSYSRGLDQLLNRDEVEALYS